MGREIFLEIVLLLFSKKFKTFLLICGGLNSNDSILEKYGGLSIEFKLLEKVNFLYMFI